MVWDGNEILRYKKTVSIKQTRMFLKVKFRSGYNKKIRVSINCKLHVTSRIFQEMWYCFCLKYVLTK